jgi:hypothetical protein
MRLGLHHLSREAGQQRAITSASWHHQQAAAAATRLPDNFSHLLLLLLFCMATYAEKPSLMFESGFPCAILILVM